MSKQKVFGRSRPSIAQELQLRRMLYKLIDSMQKDTESEIRRYFNTEVVSDGILMNLAQILKRLRQKWYKEFDVQGKIMAKWLMEKTNKRTMSQIMRKLKEIGFTIEPHYTPEQIQLIKQLTEESTAMIKSIPQQYLKNVQKVLTQSFKRGNDMETMREYIENVLPIVDKKADMVRKRAILIARDQTNKVTQNMTLTNAQALGVTKGRWIHVPGLYSSRESHIKMDKKTFLLSEGMKDPDAGNRYVKPGELPYCNCQFEVLLPGFDE